MLFLRQHLLHNVPRDIRQPEIAAHVAVGQLRVIQAQAVQHRRLQIVNVDLVFGDIESQIVRLRRPPYPPLIPPPAIHMVYASG